MKAIEFRAVGMFAVSSRVEAFQTLFEKFPHFTVSGVVRTTAGETFILDEPAVVQKVGKRRITLREGVEFTPSSENMDVKYSLELP